MLAGLLLALATGTQPAVSVAQAMASAIPLGCLLHASGASPIASSRKKELAAAGLDYIDNPPADFAADVAKGMPASWGKPTFAKVTWDGGSAWVVGFEKGECLIDATGMDRASLFPAIHDQFLTPGVPWRKLPPGAAPERYGLAIQPKGKPSIAIVANLVGIDVPPAGWREVITFEPQPNK